MSKPEPRPYAYLLRKNRIWKALRRGNVVLLPMKNWHWYDVWATRDLDFDESWNDNDYRRNWRSVIPGPWSARVQ